MEITEIWTKTLAQIEVKLDSSAQFKTWFKDTKLVGFDGRFAQIQVKNPYTADWLKNRHERMITDTLSYVVGKPLKVRFEVNGTMLESVAQPDIEDIVSNPLLYQTNGIDPTVTQVIVAAGLNERYSTDNYVVGLPNQMAHAAAMAVIDNPGTTYNPLFIYGPSGVGKTHLAQAIGVGIIARNPNRKVVYNSSEGFLNDMVKGLRKGKNLEFRQRYRRIDCLIIDDIQYISGWEKTQDEFFNTFNELYNSNKQIILVSDRKPEQIESIDARLRTRFMGGLTVEIGKPDYAMRIAVLEKKAIEKGLILPAHLIEYLAKQISDSIRELEGAIQKIALFNGMKRDGSGLTIGEIMNVIGEDQKAKREKVSLSQILKAVSDEFNVKVADLKSDRRTAEIAFARQVAMYILRSEYGYKLERIAAILNRKDHTTVLHGIDKVESKMALSEGLSEQIVRLKEKIRNWE